MGLHQNLFKEEPPKDTTHPMPDDFVQVLDPVLASSDYFKACCELMPSRCRSWVQLQMRMKPTWLAWNLGNPGLCPCFGRLRDWDAEACSAGKARVVALKPRLQLVDRDIRFFLRASRSVLSCKSGGS